MPHNIFFIPIKKNALTLLYPKKVLQNTKVLIIKQLTTKKVLQKCCKSVAEPKKVYQKCCAATLYLGNATL